MAKLKIVALIGTPVHLHYFINRIAEDHELALVIRENSRTNLLKKIREKGIFNSIAIIARHFLQKSRINEEYNRILGNQWQSLKSSVPLLTVANINLPEVVAQLDQIKPDVVIVQGTTLIKNKTIQTVPLVLNLHWGLSPYYKGSYCTEWALLNNDVHNIGYTIHKISARIDGGDIVSQGRPEIEENDTANSINMKLTREGAAMMSRVLTLLGNGAQLTFAQQDTAKGQLYLTKDWTSVQKKALKRKEAAMKTTIEASVRPPQPVITIEGQ